MRYPDSLKKALLLGVSVRLFLGKISILTGDQVKISLTNVGGHHPSSKNRTERQKRGKLALSS
jgi:hypothetical protein